MITVIFIQCSSGCIYEKPKQRVECPECKQQMCFYCKQSVSSYSFNSLPNFHTIYVTFDYITICLEIL